MTIQIADTSRATFIFCDDRTAVRIKSQLPRQESWPDGLYVISLPDAAEVVSMSVENTGYLSPAVEIDQEALSEAISRIRGR
jgi:hypothetical protein